jgi:hypothetical protein
MNAAARKIAPLWSPPPSSLLSLMRCATGCAAA